MTNEYRDEIRAYTAARRMDRAMVRNMQNSETPEGDVISLLLHLKTTWPLIHTTDNRYWYRYWANFYKGILNTKRTNVGRTRVGYFAGGQNYPGILGQEVNIPEGPLDEILSDSGEKFVLLTRPKLIKMARAVSKLKR